MSAKRNILVTLVQPKETKNAVEFGNRSTCCGWDNRRTVEILITKVMVLTKLLRFLQLFYESAYKCGLSFAQ